MTKRILLSMVALGLAASLVGGATMALLTAQTNATAIPLQAGTIAIGATGLTSWLTTQKPTWSTPISNLAPGQTARSTVTVTNNGNLPLKYRVTPSVSGDLAGKLVVSITNDSGELNPNGIQVLTVDVTLPANADSSAKGKSGTVTLSADATNPANLGWSQ
jgi:predicted ribosomally synthesized peptide with SipW-like signal peptide